MNVEVGWDFTVESHEEPFELDRAVALVQRADEFAGGQIESGVKARRAGPDVIVDGALGVPGIIGRTEAVRSRAWI